MLTAATNGHLTLPVPARQLPAKDGTAASARVLVVLPTYNEHDNLQNVIAGVRALGFDVLVVDDASPDRTGDLADALAATDPQHVSVEHRPSKQGLGSAYVAGFRRGLAEDYDLLVEMDADGSHLPEHLPAIVASALASGGLAVGSRYVPGGSIGGWGLGRWLLSRGANAYTRRVLGIGVRDATSGFRCYSRALLDQIDLSRVVAQGYAFQIEMVHRCLQLGYPVVEVPIHFEDRTRGVSKVSRSEVVRALTSVIAMRFQWRADLSSTGIRRPQEDQPISSSQRAGSIGRTERSV